MEEGLVDELLLQRRLDVRSRCLSVLYPIKNDDGDTENDLVNVWLDDRRIDVQRRR